ncbi:unnamed protein product [Clonostachys rosea f. rosea IK726]|uniref:Nucleoporin Nup82 n=2 Tax=Bionectria ochroleuca TaxID=29856 RepID=A0A0B7JUJ7_BIOOC|nr:unnamed protein product [Clonostachys rosea f. rosea IK726]
MPKVKSYSAPWLAKNAPGHQLFEPIADLARPQALSNKTQHQPGPRRTIARWGTQVFVAVGKEIRWGDLAYIKEQWTARHSRNGGYGARIKTEDSFASVESDVDLEHAPGMRDLQTIKTRCAEDIRQLVISQNSNYLAILTAYTVHICVLPDSSHLTSEDNGPLKPKMFTLGPTTHVTSRAPIMSALWHPLGVNGTCLVTVTADAIVRVWEIDAANRWSFDNPTTSVDLKKLADGTSLDQDFSASVTATNKGFSPDSFDMEVAAASFATKGSGGWDPMTLWVAMREGDVYALCPLLPQKWAPPPTLIPSLSVSIVTTVASIEDDPEVSDYEKLLAQQQLEWMGELDAQEPTILEGPPGEPMIEVYNRPSRPGTIPRLQGPFDLNADPETGDDLDTAITDIVVIGKKTETDELMVGEEEELELEERDREGASLTVVSLLSASGQVRVYLDLDGVQAQWLPPKSKSRLGRLLADSSLSSELLAFQAIDTMSPVEVNEESWPVFSQDVMSRYNLYVTHHAGIVFLSLAPWIFRLEKELAGDSEAGTDFRIGLVVNSQSSRDRLFSQPTSDAVVPLAAAVVLQDPDVGYFLLSATPYEPIALTFDSPETDLVLVKLESSPVRELEAVPAPLDFYEPRPVFQPSHAFDQPSHLPTMLDRLRTSRHKTLVNQEVRLSPVTLGIFTDAHKLLADETYRLGVAASEVFRRCEVLQAELRQQVNKANQVRSKIETISGANRDDGEGDNAAYERRIAEAQDRQDRLTKRVEGLRKIIGKATTRDLSAKERAFFNEVRTMEESLSERTSSEGGDRNSLTGASGASKPLWKRLEEAKTLQDELLDEVAALKKAEGVTDSGSLGTTELRIPQDIRRSKLQQVQGLLSRETALVEAVRARLERLQTL